MKLIYLLSILAVAKAASEFHRERVCGNRRIRPVCGGNGITYRNNCELRHFNVERIYYGECKCEQCSGELNKVCGTNNGEDYREFINTCWATCKGYYAVNMENCENTKEVYPSCDENVQRVCGVNGQTYRNACVAG